MAIAGKNCYHFGFLTPKIMKISTRISPSGFIEIMVNEIETTIFKDDIAEAEELINNLQNVIDDIKKLIE